MARIKRETKIKRLIESLDLSKEVKKAYYILIDNSINGVIYIDQLSNEDAISVAVCAAEMVSTKHITYDRNIRTIYVNAFNDVHYFNLTVQAKRRYIKTKLSPLLCNDKMCGHVFSEQGKADEILYTSVAKGFRVPQSFKDYLTGEAIPDNDIKVLLKSNPKLLQLEQARRNLSKEQKITLCLLIYLCENGEITDFNTHKLLTTITTLYKDRSYSYSTIDYCLKKLIELQLVKIYEDKVGIKRLIICGYYDAFKISKNRYVIIPDVIFKKQFKILQSSGVKVFFYLMFLLNNGEVDKDHYLGQNKAIYFKFLKTPFDSNESKKNYDSKLFWLRKRYPGELAEVLFGTSKKETAALADIFHFNKPNNKDLEEERVLQVRIRKEYFISKKTELFKPLLELKEKDRERFEAIQKAVKDINPKCKDKDVITVIKLFKNESMQFVNRILDKLTTYARNNEVYNPIGLLITFYREISPPQPNIITD